MHPVPSLLDLPTLSELEGKEHNELTGHNQIGTAPSAGQVASELRSRTNASVSKAGGPADRMREKLKDGVEKGQEEKRKGSDGGRASVDDVKRDADVLTKFIVCESSRYRSTVAARASRPAMGASQSSLSLTLSWAQIRVLDI